jgi:apolipoprotein N-acyltransferase
VSFEYWKAIPVPGPDASLQAVDDGRIQVVDTPHGRLGAAICFDMDFPGHLKQAGRQDADIMLVPSNDWREIDPWHSHMARFRAVEQGFNMVRHVSNGFSLATDYHGRVLASMDHFVTDLRDMVAVVPTRGVRTVYSRIGDLFAWLCMAGLVAAVGRSTWPTRS